MTDPNDIQTADQLWSRRARILPMLAHVFFLIEQTSFFSNPPAERAVDHVRIGVGVDDGGDCADTANRRLLVARQQCERRWTMSRRAPIGPAAFHWGFMATCCHRA